MSGRTLNRLARSGTLATPDTCEVCENEGNDSFLFGGWLTHHGWARCGHCGLHYCIVNYPDKDDYNGPEVVLADSSVAIIQEWYDEYGTRWDQDERFDDWVRETHPEALPDDGEDA